MISYFLNLAQGLFNLVYPLTCQVCGAKINTETDSNTICQGCLKQMISFMPVNPTRHNNINVWAVCAYEGTARKCIHLFKYNARLCLAQPLSQLMLNFVNKNLDYKKFDVIMPVPLHRSRLRERGFNQAEVLAKRLARDIKYPIYTSALKRIKLTPAQTGLSKTKRFTNLKGAFKITREGLVCGKRILLIDDVFTTGSTIGECSKVLLKAKAKSVEALVLAKGI